VVRIFADFQNSSRNGHVSLGCVGTRRDMERLGLEFHEGMRVILDDHDSNEADGTVRWEVGRGWVAEIDWENIRERAAESGGEEHSD
jgi:hypothetical protein